MNIIKRICRISARECGMLARNPIYLFCMIIFPILVIIFFTTLMDSGQPTDIPCGVVDLDNTSTTRSMIRRLDAFQSTRIVAEYTNIDAARGAVQRGEIYAFLYLPEGTTRDLLSFRQPKISFYYSSACMVAGNMLFKDLKTICSLGSAAVGISKLQALGKSSEDIKYFLQPTTLDMHLLNNPSMNYNIYLSTVMVPGILMMFMFLITTYSIGTELKFKRAHDWMRLSNNNIWIAVFGKLLPQFFIFITIFIGYEWYLFGYLDFPHPGGMGKIIMLGFLAVLSAEGFGVFIFGLIPSLRMSMSMCSLWAVLGFSVCGATYPIYAMNPMIESMAQLFPLRHYFMIYQVCIFNGYPLIDAWIHVVALIAFALLPVLTLRNVRKAMLEFVYIP